MPDADPARLRARHGAGNHADADVSRPGVHALGLGDGGRRDAWLAVPDAVPDPAPLLVLLHGAGSSGRAMLELLAHVAGEIGGLALAPDSVGSTWDAVRGGFGPDVARIDAALDHVFADARVDPRRTVLAGFSDGASYALSLGLPNPDVFSHVAAFSPGFVRSVPAHGRVPVFVSHGRADPVLPVDRCSRRIVPTLRRAGYDVRYVEFDGGHGIPEDVARDALRWVGRPAA